MCYLQWPYHLTIITIFQSNCEGLWRCQCFIQVPCPDSSRAMGDLTAEPVCFIVGRCSLTCHEGVRATPGQHPFQWLLIPGFVCGCWAIQLWFLPLVLRPCMTQRTFPKHEWLYISLVHRLEETKQPWLFFFKFPRPLPISKRQIQLLIRGVK